MRKQQSQFQIPREYLWALIKRENTDFQMEFNIVLKKVSPYTCRVISNDLIKDLFDQFYVYVDVP